MRIREIINIDAQAGSEYLASSAHMGFWEVYTGLAKEYYSFEYPSEICINPLDHEDLCDLVDDEVRSLRDFYSKFKINPHEFPKTAEAIAELCQWLGISNALF